MTRLGFGSRVIATMLLLASVAPARAQDGHAPEQHDAAGGHGTHERENGADAAGLKSGATYPGGIRPITDEDRAAAFPVLNGQHTVHDHAVHSFVLFEHLELQAAGGTAAGRVENRGWIGGDITRFWWRVEGESEDEGDTSAHVEALYGRAVHRWWDLLIGLRQDVGPGPDRTWGAFGIQGLAPYWFEVDVTAYLSTSGHTLFTFETDYELLLTNRLIVQPTAGFEIAGRSDVDAARGAGLTSADAGFRVRYELRREFAPYVGLTWNRKFFGTGDLAEAAGEERGRGRMVFGLRTWF